MTLNQAIGIKSCNTLVTGEEITHQEKYRRIIEFLGGLDAVIPYIPFTKEQIAKAIKKDPYLNNLSMKNGMKRLDSSVLKLIANLLDTVYGNCIENMELLPQAILMELVS